MRAQAEKALVGFSESPESLPQCQLILERSQVSALVGFSENPESLPQCEVEEFSCLDCTSGDVSWIRKYM